MTCPRIGTVLCPVDFSESHASATSDFSEPTRGILEDLTRRVRAEYAEMPGLCVTLFQAQRLWGLDPQTCETVFMTLTARGFLRKTPKGSFVRC